MGTPGTLELRLKDKTLRRSVSSDGYMVSRALVDLAEMYEEKEDPKESDFKEWFTERAEHILPNEPMKGNASAGNTIIIDPARRLVTYTGPVGYTPSDMTTDFAVRGAIQCLEQDHHYQFLEFENLSARKYAQKTNLTE